jgi:hypothetical protein
MTRTIVFAGVLVSAMGARAGDFCGSLDGPGALRELDRYAAGKGGRVDPDCFAQTYGDRLPDAVQARVLAACTKAVGLAAAKRSAELDSWCTLDVLTSGAGRVGDRDLVGEIIAKPWSWDGWPPYRALAASGDGRVRAFVLAQFATHRETWRKKKLRAAWAKDTWREHERSVLAALEKLATADDLALIAEIEADQPKDKRIARAVERAREAAGARKTPAPPAQ